MACSGNLNECGGSSDNGLVYYNPTSPFSSASKSVVVYTTTDSHGSIVITSSTSTMIPTTPVSSYTSGSVVVYTTTSGSSTYITSSTSLTTYEPPPPSITSSSVVIYTTTSGSSTYVTSSTSLTTYVPPPSPTTSSSIMIYTTTSGSSTYVTSSTSVTTFASPPSLSTISSVVVYTTASGTSTYVTSSTYRSTYAPLPSGGVTTTVNTFTTTDRSGSTITSTATSTSTSTQTSPNSVPSPLCPYQNGKAYSDSNGIVYDVYCGVDFPGNDLPAVHVNNPYDCMAACDAYVPTQSVKGGAVCVAASYGEGNVGGNCYLKYAIVDVNTNDGGIICFRQVSYTPTAPPNYLPSTTDTYAKTNTQASTFTPPTYNGGGTTSSSPPNNGGGSPSSPTLNNGGESTSSPSANNGGGSSSSPPPYNGGGQTTPITTSTRRPFSVTTSSTSSIPYNPTLAPSPCPTGDGQPYICNSGSVFDIHCGQTYPGNDLPAVHADTFSQCIEACANYIPSANTAGGASCVAASWGAGNVGGNCYLKYKVTTVIYDTGFDSCNFHGYQLPVSSSSTVQQTTTYGGGGGPTTISSTTSISTPPYNSGGGTTSSSTSTTPISVPPYNGGGGSSSTSTTSGPSSIPTLTGEPSCPRDNNTRKYDSLGTLYDTRCGFQIAGDNAQPAHADTFSECLEFCTLLGGCAAVTYLFGNNADNTNANCYPYSTFRAYTLDAGAPNVYSGVPVNGPTPIGASYNSGESLCSYGGNANGGGFTDAFGKNYAIGCDQNVLGGPGGTDLKATALRSLKACLTYCSHYDTCVSVDFAGVGAVQPNAANCYPKRAPVGSAVAAQGTSYAVASVP